MELRFCTERYEEPRAKIKILTDCKENGAVIEALTDCNETGSVIKALTHWRENGSVILYTERREERWRYHGAGTVAKDNKRHRHL